MYCSYNNTTWYVYHKDGDYVHLISEQGHVEFGFLDMGETNKSFDTATILELKKQEIKDLGDKLGVQYNNGLSPYQNEFSMKTNMEFYYLGSGTVPLSGIFSHIKQKTKKFISDPTCFILCLHDGFLYPVSGSAFGEHVGIHSPFKRNANGIPILTMDCDANTIKNIIIHTLFTNPPLYLDEYVKASPVHQEFLGMVLHQ
jgi:hypothetical protein